MGAAIATYLSCGVIEILAGISLNLVSLNVFGWNLTHSL